MLIAGREALCSPRREPIAAGPIKPAAVHCLGGERGLPSRARGSVVNSAAGIGIGGRADLSGGPRSAVH